MRVPTVNKRTGHAGPFFFYEFPMLRLGEISRRRSPAQYFAHHHQPCDDSLIDFGSNLSLARYCRCRGPHASSANRALGDTGGGQPRAIPYSARGWTVLYGRERATRTLRWRSWQFSSHRDRELRTGRDHARGRSRRSACSDPSSASVDQLRLAERLEDTVVELVLVKAGIR